MKVKGNLVKTATGKLVLYLSLDEYAREEFLLEKGKVVPALFEHGTFTVIVR
jgi:hypothetical protein